MKKLSVIALAGILFLSCGTRSDIKNAIPVIGTWRLISGTLIENGDTLVTDYTTKVSFIKIINETHFAFLEHDLNQGTVKNDTLIQQGLEIIEEAGIDRLNIERYVRVN